jgi:hypothetical protein
MLLAAGMGGLAWGNGGPFVVKYPSGDPAAKGVLARLDPSLKPAQETRLRVVTEHLTISFSRDPFVGARSPTPLAAVEAAYAIQNPTDEVVTIDFGFPILRGIYTPPLSMMLRPEVNVKLDQQNVQARIISNSEIYGLIRQRAREAIEKAVSADPQLSALVAAVPKTPGLPPKPAAPPAEKDGQTTEAAAPVPQPAPPAEFSPEAQKAREALRTYLLNKLRWSDRDAALMVEYAGIDFGKSDAYPIDRWHWGFGGNSAEMDQLAWANLGPLGAIGEQKATQLFAQLASRFDREAAADYESIFQAWGGDVRERSVDLRTGQVRPRELEIAKEAVNPAGGPRIAVGMTDPTVYARLDYVAEHPALSPLEKAACHAIIKNLPVVFTFAPMNLLYYQVTFKPKTTHVVTVSYKQYAYLDTAEPASYQLSYVVHPASLWREFGPIHLKVSVPAGVMCRASAPLAKAESASASAAAAPAQPPVVAAPVPPSPGPQDVYEAVLADKASKRGELFIGLEKSSWEAVGKREEMMHVE